MTEIREFGSLLQAASGGYAEETNRLSTALVGHKLTGLLVKPGEAELAVVTDAGSLTLKTEADCCSETWFADFVGVALALGSEITAVELVDLPTPKDDRTRQEYDEAYGIRITTTGGVLDIVYRNSSNGYYGGWHKVCEPCDTAGWRELTEDWSA
jgi:hypothetical protein